MQDRDVALAWQIEQEMLCSGCGLPRDETMAKEAMFGYRAKPVRCHACAAASRERDKFTSIKAHDASGLTFSIVPAES